MSDPYITVSGHSYEKYAIEQWLTNHDTDPFTNTPLSNKILIPNHTLRKRIESFIKLRCNKPSIYQKQLKEAEERARKLKIERTKERASELKQAERRANKLKEAAERARKYQKQLEQAEKRARELQAEERARRDYHVYWHWNSEINAAQNCTESNAYAQFRAIGTGASRIIVHANRIIESAGPTNQYKYMCAAHANERGKLSIPNLSSFYVVHHWFDDANHKRFASDQRDEAMHYYGNITQGASRAVIHRGKIIKNGGPTNDWKKACIGYIWFR
eukprot:353098_1